MVQLSIIRGHRLCHIYCKKYLGKDAVVHPEFPSMAAEDFSAYLHKIKGAFLWLGTGFEGNPALHNAAFTIDESILRNLV